MSLVERENLSESYAATPAAVSVARREVIEYARAAGATDAQLGAISLAVSEAVTNVVRHAYVSGPPGRVEVTAAFIGGTLSVIVADEGRGLRPRADSPGLGMGLALIADVCDGFEIVTRSFGGTELRMRFSVGASGRPADQSRGSNDSARSPAARSFSTTV